MIYGVDEAGRGCLIGPLVIAVAGIDPADEIYWYKQGVRDSKLLSKKKREFLYSKITASNKVTYDIRYASCQEIDSAVNSLTTNLNWLEADKTIDLIKNITSSVVIDCPSTNTQSYSNYVQKGTKAKLFVEHKADVNHVIVGIASIIAKVTRDRIIEKLKIQYNFNMGSGYPGDAKARAFTKSHMTSPDVRKSWKTYKDLL